MRKLSISIGFVLMAFVADSYGGAASTSRQDQQFVNEAARGGKMEVELGELAQKNGSSADVKAFGGQMVLDHTRLNDELGNAAKAAGLQVPTDVSAKQQAELQTLAKTSGKEFDVKYLDLMVKDHTNDLAAFKKEESSTHSPGLKKAISEAIPVIKHHLDMAKANDQKVGAH